MKKALKHIWNTAFGILAALLILYIVGMHFFPNQLKDFVGYQTFVVLTDSMEPTIPVGSLVLDKTIDNHYLLSCQPTGQGRCVHPLF